MKSRFLLLLFTATSIALSFPSMNALYMDGDGDYLQLFEAIITRPPFTIEAWVCMLGPGGGEYQENTIFEQRNLITVFGGTAVVFYAKNEQENESELAMRDLQHYVDQVKSRRPAYHEWHHLAAVASEHDMALYVDGDLMSTSMHQQTGSFSESVDHTDIGRHCYSDIVAGYFYGYIDELRIWDVALSSEEISSMMRQVIDPGDQKIAEKLLAYWNFDDVYEFYKNHTHYVGVKDLSGANHHGAFVDHATLKPVGDDMFIRDHGRQSTWMSFDNYPNPFNPSTTIHYELPSDGFATLKIHDLNGRLVRALVSASEIAGEHAVLWDGTDDAGFKAAAGIYLYQLEFTDRFGERQVLVQKMSLVK